MSTGRMRPWLVGVLVALCAASVLSVGCGLNLDPAPLQEAEDLGRSLLPGREPVSDGADRLTWVGRYVVESFDVFVLPDGAERIDVYDVPGLGERGVAGWFVAGPSGSDCSVRVSELARPGNWVRDEAVLSAIERGEVHLVRIGATCGDQ